jgi:histidinol-phosphate aminotransferase
MNSPSTSTIVPETRPLNPCWSPVVHRLTPYVPGEQPKISQIIKLNTNENPYGPSPRVLEAIQAELSDALRLYPDPNAERLKQAIADYYGITPAQVFVGNGSDEVLAHMFQAMFQHPAPVLIPGHYLQLLSGLLRSVWHRLYYHTAG